MAGGGESFEPCMECVKLAGVRLVRCADCDWTDDPESRSRFDWVVCVECERRNEESMRMENDEREVRP